MRLQSFCFNKIGKMLDFYSQFNPSPLSIKQFLDFGEWTIFKCISWAAFMTQYLRRTFVSSQWREIITVRAFMFSVEKKWKLLREYFWASCTEETLMGFYRIDLETYSFSWNLRQSINKLCSTKWLALNKHIWFNVGSPKKRKQSETKMKFPKIKLKN